MSTLGLSLVKLKANDVLVLNLLINRKTPCIMQIYIDKAQVHFNDDTHNSRGHLGDLLKIIPTYAHTCILLFKKLIR